ncbi:MAG: bifunctional nuclease family protein [Acidimicrobiales bacterium]
MPDGVETAAGAVTGPVPVPERVFRMMRVVSVEVVLPEQHPVLTLAEIEGGSRQLVFRVGMPEGTALAHSLAGTMAPRPLTHDLFTEVLERFAVDVAAVRLVGRFGATYLAELDLMGSRGRQVVACRPTDGVALALRQRVPAPILADDRLLSTTGDVPGPVV